MGRHRFAIASCSLGLSLAVLGGGCGGNEEDSIALVPVTGKVMLDGKALEGATITFIPDSTNKPATDGGDVTGNGGSFAAKYRNRPGLAPGKYKVVVGKPGQPVAGPGGPGGGPASPYMASLAAEAATKGGGTKAEKPWPYGDAATTPLKHEVAAKGDADLQFDLKTTLK